MPRTIHSKPTKMSKAIRKKNKGSFVKGLFIKKQIFIIITQLQKTGKIKSSMKWVTAFCVGNYGYHTLYKNLYTITHVPSGVGIDSFKEEKKAKILVKKLNRHEKKYGNKWKPTIEDSLQFCAWHAMCETINGAVNKQFKHNTGPETWNPKDDIPF